MTDFESAKSVVIVGAGIFGLGAAISTKKRFPDKRVVVVERLQIPAPDASSVDLNKVVRCDYGSDGLHTDLANDAIKRFLEWNAEDEKRGRPSVFHPCGVLVLSKEPMDSLESKYEAYSRKAMDANGLGSYVVDDPTNKEDVLPKAWHKIVAEGAYKGGYLNKWCGLGLAEMTVVRMADEAKELGVELLPEHPFKDFVYSSDGKRVTGITCLPKGASSVVTIEADYVVMATGAWSPSLLPELSSLLISTAQSVIHYRLNDPATHTMFTEKGGFTVWFADVYRSGFYGFPVHDETGLVKVANHSAGYKLAKPEAGPVTFTTGGTVLDSGKEATKAAGKEFTVPREELHFMREWVKKNLSDLEEKGTLESTRICWYTDSFDGRFLICPHPKIAGLHIATGGSGHAFKFAPVLGDVILDSLLGVKSRYTEAYAWRTNPDPNWSAKWDTLGDLAAPDEFTGTVDAKVAAVRKARTDQRADSDAMASGTDIWGLS
jgi:sarcosine oxidase/L-pipecolate oxidase